MLSVIHSNALVTLAWPWPPKLQYSVSIASKELTNQTNPNVYVSYQWIGVLTHWGRVTHICVIEIIIIGSDNGLSPGRRQTIIWTNAGILLIRPLGTNFSETWIEIQTFSSKKIRLKMSSAKWPPICLGLNVLTHCPLIYGINFKWGTLQHILKMIVLSNSSEVPLRLAHYSLGDLSENLD